MNKNDDLIPLIPKVIPFKPKEVPKVESTPPFKQISLQEFGNEVYGRLDFIERSFLTKTENQNDINKNLIVLVKELQSKMRVVWVGFCIGWGILIGQIINYLIKMMGKC